jgi:ArsR family transcriptional regulator, virulence genes transcriptional regulator
MNAQPLKISQSKKREIRSSLQRMPQVEHLAALMRLAGDSTRLKLLVLLEVTGGLGARDSAAALGVSFSQVYQHLAKLRFNGLVAARRDGPKSCYYLTDAPFLATLLEGLCEPRNLRASAAPRASA